MRWLAVALLALVGSCLATGCIAEGHRKVSITAFGSTFSIEDEALPNDEGKQHYRMSFDEVGELILGWLKPEPEPETDEGDGG